MGEATGRYEVWESIYKSGYTVRTVVWCVNGRPTGEGCAFSFNGTTKRMLELAAAKSIYGGWTEYTASALWRAQEEFGTVFNRYWLDANGELVELIQNKGE